MDKENYKFRLDSSYTDEDVIYVMQDYINSLEAQNKALTDMVEMQSEKISRLEVPKDCNGCKYENLKEYDPDLKCELCLRGLHDYYEPKDN